MNSAKLYPIGFDELRGWQDDDHAAAFSSLLLSAELYRNGGLPKTRALGVDGAKLGAILRTALEHSELVDDSAGSRRFFEAHFQPHEFMSNTEYPGLLTGYYEPQTEGRLRRHENFQVPILSRPDDLAELKSSSSKNEWANSLPDGYRFARQTGNGLVPYFNRSEIEGTHFLDGALASRGLEIAWLPDRVSAFYAHIQGSIRICLEGNKSIRISYDGKSGHPYTAIGKVMRDRGCFKDGPITMQSIKDYLFSNPHEQREILQQNDSYIFFQIEKNLDDDLGPRAAAGVQLTKNRSLAVDRTLHTFHTPVYVTQSADEQVGHLMIAQDTGSAILGPQRGDLFTGSGDAAGDIAGAMANSCRFSLLIPRTQTGFAS